MRLVSIDNSHVNWTHNKTQCDGLLNVQLLKWKWRNDNLLAIRDKVVPREFYTMRDGTFLCVN